MKPTLPSLLVFLAFSVLAPLHAADDSRLAALRAADDERVAAMMTADRARLEAILSDDMRYAHSTGAVDGKKSFVDTVVTVRTVYQTYDYEERNFTFPAPGIALMTGRVHTTGKNAAGAAADNRLSFLSVWREEKGHWRFLAWQSCKLLPPASGK